MPFLIIIELFDLLFYIKSSSFSVFYPQLNNLINPGKILISFVLYSP